MQEYISNTLLSLSPSLCQGVISKFSVVVRRLGVAASKVTIELEDVQLEEEHLARRSDCARFADFSLA